MSYNIHAGIGTDGRLDLDRIGGVIREVGADVVGLNEVDCATGRSQGIRQGGALAELLGYDYFYGKTMDYSGGWYGNALLSRLPIVTRKNHRLPDANAVSNDDRRREPRGLLECGVRLEDTVVHVLATHFPLLAPARVRSARYVSGMLKTLRGPVILMGDLNGEPGSEEVLILGSRLRDSFREAGRGEEPTFPSQDPKRRIDYIFVSREVRVLSAEAPPCSAASDHLPVTARLRVR